MTNQLITHRLPIDYSLMSSIRYTLSVRALFQFLKCGEEVIRKNLFCHICLCKTPFALVGVICVTSDKHFGAKTAGHMRSNSRSKSFGSTVVGLTRLNVWCYQLNPASMLM